MATMGHGTFCSKLYGKYIPIRYLHVRLGLHSITLTDIQFCSGILFKKFSQNFLLHICCFENNASVFDPLLETRYLDISYNFVKQISQFYFF